MNPLSHLPTIRFIYILFYFDSFDLIILEIFSYQLDVQSIPLMQQSYFLPA